METTRIGIVGHRFLDPAAAMFARAQCRAILQALLQTQQQCVALSAIAEGADGIFAEVALELGIPLEIVLPFAAYENDFEEEKALQLYRHLLQMANKKTCLPFRDRSVNAYYEAMLWVLKHADLVIAVWNGEPNGGKAGTADAVLHMQQSGQDWIHISTKHLTTQFHPGPNNGFGLKQV
jgi:hypothetical protein